MSFMQPNLLFPVLFQIALPCSGSYHMEWGRMPLHDAVGVNCKKDATTETQSGGVKYMTKGCMLDDFVCVI